MILNSCAYYHFKHSSLFQAGLAGVNGGPAVEPVAKEDRSGDGTAPDTPVKDMGSRREFATLLLVVVSYITRLLMFFRYLMRRRVMFLGYVSI